MEFLTKIISYIQIQNLLIYLYNKNVFIKCKYVLKWWSDLCGRRNYLQFIFLLDISRQKMKPWLLAHEKTLEWWKNSLQQSIHGSSVEVQQGKGSEGI